MKTMTMAEVLQTNDIIQQMTDEQLADIRDKITAEIATRREKQVNEAIENFKHAWFALVNLGKNMVTNDSFYSGEEISWSDISFVDEC